VNKKMLALYGLKWNRLLLTCRSRRSMSHRASSRSVGGSGKSPVKAASALATGAPGTGKSVVLAHASPSGSPWQP